MGGGTEGKEIRRSTRLRTIQTAANQVDELERLPGLGQFEGPLHPRDPGTRFSRAKV